MYQIKQLSQMIGVSPETIRHYERIGLLPAPQRADNGYRVYTDNDAVRLSFIRRARQLDFPLNSIAEILAFHEQGAPPCDYVQTLIDTKITEVRTRISELEQLRDELVIIREASHNIVPTTSDSYICQIIETVDD